MIVATDSGTSTHPAHRNSIAKSAFGRSDIAVHLLVEDLALEDALKRIETLILNCAKRDDWRIIFNTELAQVQHRYEEDKFAGYLSYWIAGIEETQRKDTDAQCKSAFALIGALSQFTSRDSRTNDRKAVFEAICVFIIERMDQPFLKVPLWRAFLGLYGSHTLGDRDHFNRPLLLAALEKGMRHKSGIQALNLIVESQTILSPLNLDEHPFGTAVIKMLWQFYISSRDAEGKNLMNLLRVARPVCTLADTEVVDACQNAVSRVVEFSWKLTSLRGTLNEKRMTRSISFEIKADLVLCKLDEVRIKLDWKGRPDAPISERRKWRKEMENDLLSAITSWAQENKTSGFKVISTGLVEDDRSPSTKTLTST